MSKDEPCEKIIVVEDSISIVHSEIESDDQGHKKLNDTRVFNFYEFYKEKKEEY